MIRHTFDRQNPKLGIMTYRTRYPTAIMLDKSTNQRPTYVESHGAILGKNADAAYWYIKAADVSFRAAQGVRR